MKKNEKCNACGLKPKKEDKDKNGHYADPCMGLLPGVMYGCCGHGERPGYLFFETGVIIRFRTTVVEKKTFSIFHKKFKKVKRGK